MIYVRKKLQRARKNKVAMFANSVLFTPAAGGTTDFTVSTAVTGFMTPALAGMPSGTYKYRAESSGLTQWEIGEGVYTSGTGVLTRATVLYNSSGTGTAAGQSGAGSKINFSVAPNVGAVQLVEDTLGIDQANSWTSGQKTQARDNIGGSTVGQAVFTAADAAAARASLGVEIYRWDNWIINGNFTVNQRGGTRTPGVGVYGYDRWKGHASGLEQVIEALPAGEYTLTWTGGGSGTFAGATAASPFKATSAGGNVSVIVPSTATKVSLVRGDATLEADPFAQRHIQQEIALCQRYLASGQNLMNFVATAGGQPVGLAVQLPVKMRTTPTVTPTSISYSNGSGLVIDTLLPSSFRSYFLSGASGPTFASFTWTAVADL